MRASRFVLHPLLLLILPHVLACGSSSADLFAEASEDAAVEDARVVPVADGSLDSSDATLNETDSEAPADGADDSSYADADADATDAGPMDADAGDADASDADASDADASDGDASTRDVDANGDEDASDLDASDAAPDAAQTDDSGTAQLRVVHAAPSFGQGIDFCIAPAGGAFGVPVLHGAGAQSMAFTYRSNYAVVGAGSDYTVRLVTGTTCATSIPGVADVDVNLSAPNESVTVALLDSALVDGGAPPTVRALIDDPDTATPSGQQRVRFIHAAPSEPAVTLRAGPASYAVALQTLAYGQTSSAATTAAGAPPPDANGYVNLPLARVDVSGLEGTQIVAGFSLENTPASTAFFVGGSSSTALGFLVCNQYDANVQPSECALYANPAATTQGVRFAHFAPDAPAVDVCARVSGLGPWVGPLLSANGLPEGEPYMGLSPPVPLPATTDSDVLWVPAGEPCTTTPVYSGGFGQYSEGVLGVLRERWSSATSHTYLAGFSTPVLAGASSTASIDVIDPELEGLSLYDTPSGGTRTLVGEIGAGGGELRPSFDAGSYTLNVTSTYANYQTTGVTLTVGHQYVWWWFHLGAASAALARCDMASIAAGTLATCAN